MFLRRKLLHGLATIESDVQPRGFEPPRDVRAALKIRERGLQWEIMAIECGGCKAVFWKEACAVVSMDTGLK